MVCNILHLRLKLQQQGTNKTERSAINVDSCGTERLVSTLKEKMLPLYNIGKL